MIIGIEIRLRQRPAGSFLRVNKLKSNPELVFYSLLVDDNGKNFTVQAL